MVDRPFLNLSTLPKSIFRSYRSDSGDEPLKSKTLLLSGIVFLAIAILAYAFWPRGNGPVGLGGGNQADNIANNSDSPADGAANIGGVRRPDADLPVADQDRDKADAEESKDSSDRGYGSSPLIDPDANPQVAAVVKASQEGNRPELLSPAIPAKPFDLVAYQKNPQAWLDSPEPGRVFQPAQPSPETPVLRRRSDYRLPVVQGETVRLAVHAAAGVPVAFTAFDLGVFPNQLTAITVVAGDDGVASTEFLATPGTINDVNILAASPMASGQVKFVVNVSLPEN